MAYVCGMSNHPTDLRYTDKHAWARTGEKPVRVGITRHAADAVGAVSFVELPYPGELFKPGELIARVSSKTGSGALYMPFVGQINAVNQALDGSPGLVSSDPYGMGWLVLIEPSDVSVVEALMSADDYEAFLAADGG